MKKTVRRILSLLMAFSMVMSLLTVTAFADGEGEDAVRTSAEQIVSAGGTKYYTAEGAEVEASGIGDKDAAVALTKTLEATPYENVFDVTLKVETNLKQEENFTITEK